MRALFTLVLALTALACDARRPAEAGSVLLVTLDTTRADALGCYGNPVRITPNLDRLASESVLYEAARTVAPITLPAHASMLTGLYPPRHGVADNGFKPLPDSAATVAELARASGVQTAAFVAAVVLDPAFGIAQGFETYVSPSRETPHIANSVTDWPANEVVERALAWLAGRDREQAFFLWVHLYDPHAPHEPPAELRERAQGSAYLGEVAAADLALGRLFDALRGEGELARTLVIVVGDHGESLGQHGEATHGAFVYESTLRVPLLVRHPSGARAGERSTEIASVVDVAPTACAALGLAPLERIDGRDLSTRVPADRGVYFESYQAHLAFDTSPLAGWVDARGKYLHSSKPEFYEPSSDPRERRNRIDESAAEVARYRDAIAQVWAQAPLADDGARGVDAELRQGLRELGYTAMEAPATRLPSPLAASDRPSPVERAELMRSFWEATNLAYTGQLERAIEVLRELDVRHPECEIIATTLAGYLIQRGWHAVAKPILERLIATGAARAITFHALGTCCERAGDREGAVRNYTRALELDPGHPHTRASLERVRLAPYSSRP